MNAFELFSILIVVAALFAYFNHRFLRLPTAIGLMVLGLLMSLFTILVGKFFPAFREGVEHTLSEIDFSTFLLNFILSFLLFAGSLHVKLPLLFMLRKQIFSYATIGVLLSTFIIASLTYVVLSWFSIDLDFISCLLFGALISPTDPIAVMGILKKAGIPKKIETEIVGESLFNDGTGVVVFLTILQILKMGVAETESSQVALLIVQEVGGGLVLGALLGYAGFFFLRSIDHYQTEVLITLALVMGGYTLADYLHFSGPLAMVLAGLITGNTGRDRAMSNITADYVDKFWELIDEILNALLFVLIGLEFLLIPFQVEYIFAGTLAIFIVLFSRFVSVGIPLFALDRKGKDKLKILTLLTWGGLRGGISVALALSVFRQVPHGPILVVMTYIVVLFSIIIQGLSIEKVIKKLNLSKA